MTVSLKDGLKLLGVAVMSGCAVFVCTFFLNFYLDASAVRGLVAEAVLPLYEAQLLTAKLVCCISGGCLLLVSVVLLAFYIKLYLDSHSKQLGILKAMGYGSGRIALGFWAFGLSVLVGTAIGHGCGYAVSPLIYRKMGGEGLPDIPLTFHGGLLALLVLLPTAAFSALAVGTAYFRLRRSALSMMQGAEKSAGKFQSSSRELPFLRELRGATLKSKKSLVFFVSFACFCYASMLQMSFSMDEYASSEMGAIIFCIGIVLAATALILAFTSLVTANVRTVAVIRANGYTLRQCGSAVLGGYRP
ncbi:MAG: ABC transporter permease, partial [Clostridia bacterium]|nr:ABC transporter permease [Clostridia bacterium]